MFVYIIIVLTDIRVCVFPLKIW